MVFNVSLLMNFALHKKLNFSYIHEFVAIASVLHIVFQFSVPSLDPFLLWAFCRFSRAPAIYHHSQGMCVLFQEQYLSNTTGGVLSHGLQQVSICCSCSLFPSLNFSSWYCQLPLICHWFRGALNVLYILYYIIKAIPSRNMKFEWHIMISHANFIQRPWNAKHNKYETQIH